MISAPNVELPLTKAHRDIIKRQIHVHRESTVSALLYVLNHKSKIECLTCPNLWKAKVGIEQLSYTEADHRISRHKSKLQKTAEEQCPVRFVSYCSKAEIRHSHLLVQVAMTQAAAKRKLYVWPSFDPHTIKGDLVVSHMVNSFKLYTLHAYFDLSEPQLCKLFMYTNASHMEL